MDLRRDKMSFTDQPPYTHIDRLQALRLREVILPLRGGARPDGEDQRFGRDGRSG